MTAFKKFLPSASRRSFKLGAIALVASLGMAACGSDDTRSGESGDATVSIADAWSREPADGQSTSAVYGVVTNNGDEAITAIAASTPTTDTAELHQVTMNDEGQMSMSEKEGGYTIEAGKSFVFEPGGPHIMLLDIDPATYPDMVEMTLEFDNGTTLAFEAEVRPIGDDSEMDTETEMDDDMDG